MDKETKVNSSHELIKSRHESTKSRLDLTNQNLWLTFSSWSAELCFSKKMIIYQGNTDYF